MVDLEGQAVTMRYLNDGEDEWFYGVFRQGMVYLEASEDAPEGLDVFDVLSEEDVVRPLRKDVLEAVQDEKENQGVLVGRMTGLVEAQLADPQLKELIGLLSTRSP